MFSSCIKNINSLYDKARSSKHVIYDDFFVLYEIIDNYVKENNIIVSNKELLAGEEKKGISSYILYSSNIFAHANKLSNILSEHTIYVKLFTNVKNEDFIIIVNNYRLIQLYNITKKLELIINPLVINEFLIYPPEFELMQIYHDLYNPSKASEWEKTQELEIKIYEKFIKRKTIIGGKKKVKQLYPKHILNWLMNKKNCILIGINGINLINSTENYKSQFQIIANEVFIQEFSTFIFQITGRETNVKKYSNLIQNDKLLVKHSIYIKFPQGNLKIMNVWNSIEYELVPYKTIKNIRVGSNNVILRFLLVNIWNTRILDFLNKKKSTSLLNEIINYVNLIRGEKIKLNKYSYMGTYIDPIREKQKKSITNTFYPYVPKKYKLKHGKYRDV